MPEVRLCDKDAEIERIKKYCSERGCEHKYWSVYCKACEVADMIDEFESAQEVEAEPVRHGRWIPLDSKTAKCSCCGWWQHAKTYHLPDDIAAFSGCYRFCTACGARMEG